MKKIKSTHKNNFLKKLFIKLCRVFGYEIIDQNDFTFPVSNKTSNKNLSIQGKNAISIPLGKTSITRPVKSLDIILKTCTTVNLVTQSKKRIFEEDKSEYTFRTLKSLIHSLNFNKDIFKNIDIQFFLVDHNSKEIDLTTMKKILEDSLFKHQIIKLNVDNFPQIKTLNKNNPIIEANMRSTMASILTSFEIAKKNSNDLVYFVEDDYIHSRESLGEMVLTYEKIASEINRELFLCAVDYPYLYKKTEGSNILIGNKYHWRTVNESLLTFLTSKQMIEKYWEKLKKMAENENSPFEVPLHHIYEKETCLSPVPSLAMHCTNVNSVFGLSPNINWKKLWEENKP
jgi:hypothetical protein